MAKNYTKGKSIKPQNNKAESSVTEESIEASDEVIEDIVVEEVTEELSIRKYTYIGEGKFFYKGVSYKKGAEFLLTEDEFEKHFKVFNLFK